jgi:hypothetical protein
MKIFRIDRPLQQWPDAATKALLSSDEATLNCLPARLIADSAVNRNDRPAFVPDFAREGWQVEVRPAIHIGRLGKYIAPRFAYRYVDQISLVAILTPTEQTRRQNQLADVNPLSALYDSFDGALTAGLPFPLRLAAPASNEVAKEAPSAQDPTAKAFPDFAAKEAVNFSTKEVPDFSAKDAVASPDFSTLQIDAEFVSGGETTTQQMAVSLADLHVEETVALISRFTMLKSGDLILPAALSLAFPISLNASLTARLNALPALSLRLK